MKNSHLPPPPVQIMNYEVGIMNYSDALICAVFLYFIFGLRGLKSPLPPFGCSKLLPYKKGGVY